MGGCGWVGVDGWVWMGGCGWVGVDEGVWMSKVVDEEWWWR